MTCPQTYYLGFDARKVQHWTDTLNAQANLILTDRAEALRLAKEDGWTILFRFIGPNAEDLILTDTNPVLKSAWYEQALHRWRKRK
jgi:hypothetical protein